MIRRPPRSTQSRSSAASDVYKRQDSAPLRRELGPVAWCALECLVARSDPGRNGTTAAASVRSLAVDLGVAKNTAHRAISALVRAGLITSVQDRLHDGRFRAGEY